MMVKINPLTHTHTLINVLSTTVVSTTFTTVIQQIIPWHLFFKYAFCFGCCRLDLFGPFDQSNFSLPFNINLTEPDLIRKVIPQSPLLGEQTFPRVKKMRNQKPLSLY